MVAMRVMKMAIDKVVDVIAVRHRRVTATRSVHMAGLVATAVVVRRAAVRIFRADFESVLVDMIAMRVVQVTVMQVVDMVAMSDGGVATVRTVLMVVMGVVRFVAGAHAMLLAFD